MRSNRGWRAGLALGVVGVAVLALATGAVQVQPTPSVQSAPATAPWRERVERTFAERDPIPVEKFTRDGVDGIRIAQPARARTHPMAPHDWIPTTHRLTYEKLDDAQGSFEIEVERGATIRGHHLGRAESIVFPLRGDSRRLMHFHAGLARYSVRPRKPERALEIG